MPSFGQRADHTLDQIPGSHQICIPKLEFCACAEERFEQAYLLPKIKPRIAASSITFSSCLIVAHIILHRIQSIFGHGNLRHTTSSQESSYAMVQSSESIGALRFLELPRELRDRVYAVVLTSERQPHASPEECGGRRRDIDALTMRRHGIPDGLERYRDIWYKVQPVAVACARMPSCTCQIS